MSITNPDWRVEIWHAGSKAAEIRNDKWHLVLADLAQFAATRAESVELELEPEKPLRRADLVQFAARRAESVELDLEPAPPEVEVAPAASEPEAANDNEPETEADAESSSMYWAHFAAAALQHKNVSPESAAIMADEMLAEYGKRFPEAA